MISEFAKEKVFWTRKMNLKLVKFIESRPNIWNPKHPKYTSLESRDQTYNEFASKYGNEFTGQAVKDRWTNIRSTFANYLRKLTASREKMDCEEYKVNWHLWEPCQFLLKVNRKVKLETAVMDKLEGADTEYIEESTSNDCNQNWSTEEENNSETNEPNDSTCKSIADNLVNIFKTVQNDPLGLDNTDNGRVGRIVTRKLSQMNSFYAAKASQKIMEILLLYDRNNPLNPSNINSDCL